MSVWRVIKCPGTLEFYKFPLKISNKFTVFASEVLEGYKLLDLFASSASPLGIWPSHKKTCTCTAQISCCRELTWLTVPVAELWTGHCVKAMVLMECCQPVTEWVRRTNTDLFPSSRGLLWWVMLVLELLTDLLQTLEANWRLRFSISNSLFFPCPFIMVRPELHFFWHAAWHVGSLFPDQELNPYLLHWKLGVLATDYHRSPPELYSQDSSCLHYCLSHLTNRAFPQYVSFHIYTYHGVCFSENLN